MTISEKRLALPTRNHFGNAVSGPVGCLLSDRTQIAPARTVAATLNTAAELSWDENGGAALNSPRLRPAEPLLDRVERGSRKRHVAGELPRNRHLAPFRTAGKFPFALSIFVLPVLELVLPPVGVLAGVLGVWRYSADLGWTADFFIVNGLFSHYQLWFAVAIGVTMSLFLLKHGAGSELPWKY